MSARQRMLELEKIFEGPYMITSAKENGSQRCSMISAHLKTIGIFASIASIITLCIVHPIILQVAAAIAFFGIFVSVAGFIGYQIYMAFYNDFVDSAKKRSARKERLVTKELAVQQELAVPKERVSEVECPLKPL
jgi:hypothetical protein